MPLTTIVKNGKGYQVDPDSMNPEGRAKFDNDVKSGAVMVLASPGAPKTPAMSEVFAPLKFKGKDAQGREGASFMTPEATNRARTMIAGLPGAAMGGPAGLAAHFATGVGLPDSMMDQSNAESVGSGLTGLLGGGASKLLRGLKTPFGGQVNSIGREMLAGAGAGAAGDAARQGVQTGTVDPGQMALAAGGNAVGSGLGGVPEYIADSSAMGKMASLMQKMRGGPIAHPKEVSTSIAGARGPAAMLSAQDPKKLLTTAEQRLEAMATKNMTPLALPQQSPALPKEVQELQDKMLTATTPGERGYHAAKLQEYAQIKQNSAMTQKYEKLIGAPANFEAKNKDLFNRTIKDTDLQLAEVDKEAEKLKSMITGSSNPAVKGYFKGVKPSPDVDAEFANLAQRRQKIIQDRNENIGTLVELDRNRLAKVQTYGYDKDAAEEQLGNLRTQVNGTTQALPTAVRAAMEGAGAGESGFVKYLGSRNTNANDLREVMDYMKKQGGSAHADTRAAVINNFFDLAKDPVKGDYSAIGKALEAYNGEKLGVLFDSPKEGEKFAKLAKGVLDASSPKGGQMLQGLSTVSGAKKAIALLGSTLIFSDTMHIPTSAVGAAAGGALSIAASSMMEKAMKSPAFYHQFKDFTDKAAQGIRVPMGKELSAFLKEYGTYKTPAELQQQAEETRRREMMMFQDRQALQGGPPQGQPTPQPGQVPQPGSQPPAPGQYTGQAPTTPPEPAAPQPPPNASPAPLPPGSPQ